eukprot:scaffold6961_cov227-Amphora_coffeaeformis.AAC.4
MRRRPANDSSRFLTEFSNHPSHFSGSPRKEAGALAHTGIKSNSYSAFDGIHFAFRRSILSVLPSTKMGNRHSSNHSVASTSVSSGCSQEKSRSSRHKQKHLSVKSKKDTPLKPRTSPIPENPSEAILVTLQWVKAKNSHNVMNLYAISCPDATFYFPDADMTLDLRAFWDSMMLIFEGFPDLTFSYSDIKEVKPGVVVMENYVGGGHHNGPYSFGHEAVLPPSGAYVEDEPIKLTLYTQHGKVKRMVADSKGGIVGPPGFYAKAKAAMTKEQ